MTGTFRCDRYAVTAVFIVADSNWSFYDRATCGSKLKLSRKLKDVLFYFILFFLPPPAIGVLIHFDGVKRKRFYWAFGRETPLFHSAPKGTDKPKQLKMHREKKKKNHTKASRVVVSTERNTRVFLKESDSFLMRLQVWLE